MRICKIATFLFLFTALTVKAQDLVNEDVYLSREGVKRLVNNKFGGLVTGQSTSTNLVNYAALNPTTGTVNFNGSFPMGKDTSSFSFLTFKITGDLISDSYVSLFQNAKLNTNVSVSAQWDFRRRKFYKYKFFSSDKFNLDQKVFALENQKNEAIDKLQHQLTVNASKLFLARTQTQLVAGKLQLQRDTFDLITAQLVDLHFTIPVNTDSSQKLSDSLSKIKSKVEQLEKDLFANRWQHDSLNQLTSHPARFFNAMLRKTIADFKTKKRALEDSANISAIRFGWFSLFAAGGKKKFYTFDPTLQFEDQLQEKKLETWRLGLMYNHYSEISFPRKRIFLFNVGLFRYDDNNTSLLSTKDIAEEIASSNGGGDLTRKISKTYKAYTDQIVDSKVWNFSSNFYFLSPTKKSGIHLYPSVDTYDKGKTFTHFGIGYIISFKNTEKDKPVINAEGYIQFQDLWNVQNLDKVFLKRNEIGVRLSLPFTFF